MEGHAGWYAFLSNFTELPSLCHPLVNISTFVRALGLLFLYLMRRT